ncbi:MAG: type I glyceraldehyde-3-phosphate dehydrogenase [Dehalococcoidia bacterium]|nr:type I glyceraldehyde-3-phosphate dehydrogenase [Dehalococcoidia bacterium]
MPVKVGINGFGRIGRQALRIIATNYSDSLDIVAVNSMRSPSVLAHLLKYDSTYGTFTSDIDFTDKDLIINDKRIKILSGLEPSLIPWESTGAQIIIEATGKFKQASQSHGHINRGASKVIITAPGKGVDISIVPGVNHTRYDHSAHHIISCASCTTNCLAPIAMVLHDAFTINKGFVFTVHAYTSSQVLLDEKNKDLRRARSALQNTIPSTTGASKAIGEIIPALKGRMMGSALRVPIPTVSLLDLTVILSKTGITAKDINDALREAARGKLKGILDVCDAELVSSDFKGTRFSAVVDSSSTTIIDGMAKILAWYDNEYSYTCRIVDLLVHVAESLSRRSGPQAETAAMHSH